MLASKELPRHMQYCTLTFYVIIYRTNVSTKLFVYLFWKAPTLNPCREPQIYLVSPGVLATVHNKRALYHTKLTISKYRVVKSIIS